MTAAIHSFIRACEALHHTAATHRSWGWRVGAWLWTLPMQSISGWMMHRFIPKSLAIRRVGDCTVYLMPGPHGRGLSMGSTLFIWIDLMRTPGDAWFKTLIAHEYGHWEQAKRYGPFWLLLIGLPSFVWASNPLLRRLRRRRHVSYYALYTEKGADHLGGRALRHVIRRG